MALVNLFWCVVARKGILWLEWNRATDSKGVSCATIVVTPTKARKANNAISRDTVRGGSAGLLRPPGASRISPGGLGA